MTKPVLYSDLLSLIDSILAEAGDERAPVKVEPKGESRWSKWDVFVRENVKENRLDVITSMLCALEGEFVVLVPQIHRQTIQGWIDRLRGIRAALEPDRK